MTGESETQTALQPPNHSATSTWNTSSTEQSNTTSSSSRSSSSSQKFNLDESSTDDIVVYRYQQGMRRGEISSQMQLCKMLDKDPSWRCSRKPIPRGSSRVEIRQCDFFNEPERTRYAELPNHNNSYASVGLPNTVKWRRMFFGQFQELFILSPYHSPSSSKSGSVENSPSD